MSVTLFLCSTTPDGDKIADGTLIESLDEAREAVKVAREEEKEIAELFGDEPYEVAGRVYDGDPTTDHVLTFIEEV